MSSKINISTSQLKSIKSTSTFAMPKSIPKSILKPKDQKPKDLKPQLAIFDNTPMINILKSYIQNINDSHLTDKQQQIVDKYSSDKIIANFNKRIKILEKQNKEFLSTVIVRSVNGRSAYGYFPDFSPNNANEIKFLEDLDITFSDVENNQYIELLNSPYMRVCFDIDPKIEEDDEDIEHAILSIKDIIDELSDKFPEAEFYSFTETSTIPEYSEYEPIKDLALNLVFCHQQLAEKGKRYSTHIYSNLYCQRDVLLEYMTLKKKTLQANNCFDTSIYKSSSTNQKLRLSFSAKIDNDSEKSRFASDEVIERFDEEIKPHLDKIHANPSSTDINITDFLNEEVKHLKPTVSNIPFQKQLNNIRNVFEQTYEPSIFRFISKDLTDYEDPNVIDAMNHFDLSGKLMNYQHLPLSNEEFVNEIELLLVNTKLHSDEFTEKTMTKLDYSQDYSQTFKLFKLKKYASKKLDLLNEEKKKSKELPSSSKSDEVISSEDVETKDYKEEKRKIMELINKLDYYIGKYNKLAFCDSPKFDVFKTYRNPLTGSTYKKSKILSTVFRTPENIYYYYYSDDRFKFFKSENEFKIYFHLYSSDATEISNQLAVFNSHSEFLTLYARTRFEKLNDSEKQRYYNNVKMLFRNLKTTFVSDEDFKTYIGWLALKVRNSGKSIFKSIINQSDETDENGAQDAFKTYIIDLMSNFIDTYKAQYNLLIEGKNGAYFLHDILCIEELPDQSKEPKIVAKFQNVIKQYSQTLTATYDCKGINPFTAPLQVDFVINTNHTTSSLFYDSKETEANLKRFKIFVRKTISPKYKQEILDKFTFSEDAYLSSYALYSYLLNDADEYISEYFIQIDKRNAIEEKYYKSRVDIKSSTTLIETSTSIKEFTETINSYIQKNKRLKLRGLIDYIKSITKSTASHETIRRNLELKDVIVKSGDKNYKFTKNGINNLYSMYFKYIEDSEDDENNEDSEDDSDIENNEHCDKQETQEDIACDSEQKNDSEDLDL